MRLGLNIAVRDTLIPLLKVNEETDLNIPTEAGQTRYKFESLVADLTDIPERLRYPVAYKVINEANYPESIGINADDYGHFLPRGLSLIGVNVVLSLFL